MLSLDDAFAKFKTRLELTEREQEDVSNRHYRLRDVVAAGLHVERDFLTGSYKRETKTKPLKDVDVFCVLHDDERGYRSRPPRDLLEKVASILVPIYGKDRVCINRRSVTVDFGVPVADDETDGKVMSIDVVPAFTKGDHYEIPDTAVRAEWTETNPEVHARLATDAHQRFSHEWKPLVRMIKKWNRQHDKPVQPSFLLEVMALELLRPPFSGGYPYELKSFFATAAERIHGTWPDPAGLGPPVSDAMTAVQQDAAQVALMDAQEIVTKAILLARKGKNEDALRAWRELFGPLFPLS